MHDATSVLPALALNDLPPSTKAAVSFLASYREPTLGLYQRYLRVWFEWCTEQGIDPLEAERGHLTLWVREFGKTHKASTVGSAFTPIRGYYKYAYLDGVIGRDPAAHVRLPKITYTRQRPVDRYDHQRFLLAAKDISPRHWALTQLLGVMALRVSEALSLTVDQALNVEGGMRVLRYIGKGDKPAVTPIPYPSVASIDAAIGDRTSGWLIPTRAGGQLSRHGAAGLIETVNRHASISQRLNPHYLRKLAITQAREAGLSLDEAREFARHEDERTTRRHYDLTETALGAHPVHAIGARLAI